MCEAFRGGAPSLAEIIQHLQRRSLLAHAAAAADGEGDAPSAEALPDGSPQPSASRLTRKRRLDRNPAPLTAPLHDYPHNNNNNNTSANNNNNNNNHVKNERLSPGTPDLSGRSRSVTPSSHPDTPPAPENLLSTRNYSDFMRSLAAKYNNTNPNDYFSIGRNGFPPSLDARFKPALFPPAAGAAALKEDNGKKTSDFNPLLNPFANPTMFTPLIDMSSTQTLLALMRTAKEAEIQRLLKNVKRQDSSSPLDLSPAAPPQKRTRTQPRAPAPPPPPADSPKLHEDISHWNIEDVVTFVSGIDICAEYAQTFREQRIDGAGLPLLTEEHLTTTMNMKLGPALKLRSILAKKLGSCSVCLHCTHCHTGASPEPGGATTSNTISDTGGLT